MNKNRNKRLILMQLWSIVLSTSLVTTSAQAQAPANATANDGSDTRSALPLAPGFTSSSGSSGLASMHTKRAHTNIDESVIKEFAKAWRDAGSGTTGCEGVVLIFRMVDGSYTGKSQGFTNEYRKFTFKWNPAAIAIVHTHPNSSDPRPGEQDRRVADRYGVPNCTITTTGMFAYDPATKQISKVMDGLDWLNPSKWTEAAFSDLTRF